MACHMKHNTALNDIPNGILKMHKSENTQEHSSDSEKETWFESINNTLPAVNINIFKEAIQIAEQTFKNIKKNYGSHSNK